MALGMILRVAPAAPSGLCGTAAIQLSRAARRRLRRLRRSDAFSRVVSKDVLLASRLPKCIPETNLRTSLPSERYVVIEIPVPFFPEVCHQCLARCAADFECTDNCTQKATCVSFSQHTQLGPTLTFAPPPLCTQAALDEEISAPPGLFLPCYLPGSQVQPFAGNFFLQEGMTCQPIFSQTSGNKIGRIGNTAEAGTAHCFSDFCDQTALARTSIQPAWPYGPHFAPTVDTVVDRIGPVVAQPVAATLSREGIGIFENQVAARQFRHLPSVGTWHMAQLAPHFLEQSRVDQYAWTTPSTGLQKQTSRPPNLEVLINPSLFVRFLALSSFPDYAVLFFENRQLSMQAVSKSIVADITIDDAVVNCQERVPTALQLNASAIFADVLEPLYLDGRLGPTFSSARMSLRHRIGIPTLECTVPDLGQTFEFDVSNLPADSQRLEVHCPCEAVVVLPVLFLRRLCSLGHKLYFEVDDSHLRVQPEFGDSYVFQHGLNQTEFGGVEVHYITSSRVSVWTALLMAMFESSALLAHTIQIHLSTDAPLHVTTKLQHYGIIVGEASYWISPAEVANAASESGNDEDDDNCNSRSHSAHGDSYDAFVFCENCGETCSLLQDLHGMRACTACFETCSIGFGSYSIPVDATLESEDDDSMFGSGCGSLAKDHDPDELQYGVDEHWT